jgi:putative ABC transport system substrate-binding protein
MKLSTTVLSILTLYFFFFSPISFGAEKSKILLINSNASVEKYKVVQDEFKKNISMPTIEVNLESVSGEDIEHITSYDPKMIYCIGSKAYSFAAKYFGNKEIIFSSILNYRRLTLTPKTYGISNEPHPRMPAYISRSIFPSVRRIGMLYSKEYTIQWFESIRDQAKELGIDIIGQVISDPKDSESFLKQLLGSCDAIWLISDPLVIPEERYLLNMLKLCDTYKKPVFSYNEIFAELGAVLVVSVDDPTIGRQAADMASGLLSTQKSDEKVQFPAGSQVILNLKKAKEYGLEYNPNALGVVNTIIK